MATRFALFGGATMLGAAINSLWSAPTNVARAYGEDNKLLSAPERKSRVFDHHFRPFRLGEVINLAEDVAIFRFLTPSPDDEFHLVPCSTLQTMYKTGTMLVDQVSRFYTPITKNGTKGYFDILVKKQPNGRMTETLFAMDVGEQMYFRVIQYKLSYAANKFKHIGMIAGGTGITPMYQVLQHSLDNPEDRTKITLLFGNQRENKILLRGCLDDYAQRHGDRFSVHYIVDKTDNPDWKGHTGFITKPLVKQLMPPSSEGDAIKVLVCGPDKMMATVCGTPFGVLKAMSSGAPTQPAGTNLINFADPEGILGDLGYSKEQLYRF